MKTDTNTKEMIVENPINGQKVDLMPLFNYLESIKDDLHPNKYAEPYMICEAIDYMTEQHINFEQAMMEKLNERTEISAKQVDMLLEGISQANQLKKPFYSMCVNKVKYTPEEIEKIINQFPIQPPIPKPINARIVNPANNEKLKIEPLFDFINSYGEDAKYTANVIEHTANKDDADNPKIDLSFSTDLLRDLAKCLREMAS